MSEKKSSRKLVLEQVGLEYKKGETKNEVYQRVGNYMAGKSLDLSEIKEKLSEHDEFLTNPLEIEEGVSQCPKCKCKKILTTAKQTRGGDEGTSTFYLCSNCSYKWVYSG